MLRALALWTLLAGTGLAATITVDTLADAGAGNCTFREAVAAANTDAPVDGCAAGSGADVIDLTGLTGTITLTDPGVQLTSPTTVSGPGARTLRISGGGATSTSALLRFGGSAAITIEDVSIGDKVSQGLFAGCLVPCHATLTLRRVRVNACSGIENTVPVFSVGTGAALATNCSDARVRIVDSTFDHNDVTGSTSYGGAVDWAGDVLEVVNSTFSANTSSGNGGALLYGGTGAGLLRNVTFSGNAAPAGGALFVVSSTLTIENALFAGNTGGNCGFFVPSPDLVAERAARAAPGQSTMTTAYVVSDDASCELTGPGDQPDADAELGPLADNGGPTDTHLPSAASAAIDAGDPTGCLDLDGAPLVADQRGLVRPLGLCDAGAVEAGGSTTTTTTTSASTTTTTTLAGIPVEGTRLRWTRAGRAPAATALQVVSRDADVSAGADPLTLGGSLRVRAEGGAFVSTIPLPSSAWKRLGKAAKPKGFRARTTTPRGSVQVRFGKGITVVLRGDGVGPTLASRPDPVEVEVAVGATRYCLTFGGTVAFKAGRKFVATGAPATNCP